MISGPITENLFNAAIKSGLIIEVLTNNKPTL